MRQDSRSIGDARLRHTVAPTGGTTRWVQDNPQTVSLGRTRNTWNINAARVAMETLAAGESANSTNLKDPDLSTVPDYMSEATIRKVSIRLKACSSTPSQPASASTKGGACGHRYFVGAAFGCAASLGGGRPQPPGILCQPWGFWELGLGLRLSSVLGVWGLAGVLVVCHSAPHRRRLLPDFGR